MSLRISSSVYPIASLAAIFAIGKPVALDASAEERETRGFISITTSLPSRGFTANWMFEPPVSTPISRMIATAASRISWYSRSVRVCAGATVIESPVCTPIGSKFSIEQMITTLSWWSRITSSSNSFQPSTLSSIRHWWRGDCWRAHSTRPSNSESAKAMLPPVPPSVKLGRMMAGIPVSRTISRACASEVATPERGSASPILRMALRNWSRSSALWIAARLAPISSTPCFASTPRSARSTARFSAVCPPRVGSSTSGFSRAITFSRLSTVIGSM